jgi:hypothetical protein
MSGILQVGGVALASHNTGTDLVSLDSGIVFPANHVIQVVVIMNTTDTTVTTEIDFMSASIKPASESNKILITAHVSSIAVRGSDVNSEGLTRFYRGATLLNIMDGITPWKGASTYNRSVGSMSASYYDAPLSTSLLTYYLKISGSGSGFDINDEGGVSSLTLMEISA